jgi:hypothetical protein
MKTIFNFNTELESCRRELLATMGSSRIERCQCGAIHVSVGAVTIRATAEVLRDLSTALSSALAQVDHCHGHGWSA